MDNANSSIIFGVHTSIYVVKEGDNLKAFDPFAVDVPNSNSKYYAFLGNDGELNKPIIIQYGFPTPSQLENMEDPIYHTMRWTYFAERLMEYGYDVIFPKYNDEETALRSMITNAGELKTIVNYINAVKWADHESIVIGQSQGGLISRIALKEMEMDHEQDVNQPFHKTRLWISFDSPHQSAHIPVGMQMVAEDVRTFVHLFYTGLLVDIPQLDATHRLNASVPAMQSMLRYKSEDSSPYLTSFINYLNTIKHPEELRKISFISGSNLGKKQSGPIAPGIPILALSFDAPAASNIFGIPNSHHVEALVLSNRIDGSLSPVELFSVNSVIPDPRDLAMYRLRSHTFDNRDFVRSPGGLFDTQKQIVKWLPLELVNLAVPSVTITSFGTQHHNFTPIFSTLDLDPNKIYLNQIDDDLLPSYILQSKDENKKFYAFYDDEQNGKAYTRRELIEQDITPFDDIYAQSDNVKHTFLVEEEYADKDEDDFSDDDLNFINLPEMIPLLDAIIEMEVMPDNLCLQDHITQYDTDYEAEEAIYVGNDVNIYPGKMVETGDYVVSTETHVEFAITDVSPIENPSDNQKKILFKPGFKVEAGGTMQAFIESGPKKGNIPESPPQPPFFRGISSLLCSEMDSLAPAYSVSIEPLDQHRGKQLNYFWELLGTDVVSNNNVFLIPPDLGSGYYTLQCTATDQFGLRASYSRTLEIKPDPAVCNFPLTKQLEFEEAPEILKQDDEFLNNSVEIYPNPAVINARLAYTLKESGNLDISLYGFLGIKVKNLVYEENHEAGSYQVNFNTNGLNSGVYIYKMTFNDEELSGRFVIFK